MPLNSDVIHVMRFDFGCGLNFDQIMAEPSHTRQNVRSNENAFMLKSRFENCRNLGISDEFVRGLNSFVHLCSPGLNRYSTRKCCLCHESDLITLLDDSFTCVVKLSRKFRLMH